MNRLFLVILIFLAGFIYSHELTGNASWYGGEFIGRQTANGEIFVANKFTAAHKTLPFGTEVEVVNLSNNSSVRVRINDRGPFIPGRIIDLSEIAAKEIDIINTGVAKVKIKILSMPQPPQVTDIQVGAFRDLANAKRLRETLKKEGFNPTTSLGNNGIVRVMLKGIPIAKTYETVEKLEGLNITKVVITQRS
jgi:rare lipoprotein A